MNEFSLSPRLYRLIDLHPMSVPHLSTLCYRVPRYPESRYATGPWTICDLRHTNYLPNPTALIYPAGQHRTKTTHVTFMPHHPTILHQPRKSWFYVKFRFLTQILNGIPVSRPPFFGERPYPRQFHPVEMTPIFTQFSSFYTIHRPHIQCSTPNYSIYHTQSLLFILCEFTRNTTPTTHMIICHIVISHEYLSSQVYTTTPRYQIPTF